MLPPNKKKKIFEDSQYIMFTFCRYDSLSLHDVDVNDLSDDVDRIKTILLMT